MEARIVDFRITFFKQFFIRIDNQCIILHRNYRLIIHHTFIIIEVLPPSARIHH